MKSRTVILGTILLPAVLLGLFIAIPYLREWKGISYPHTFHSSQTTLYGEDGTTLPTVLTIPDGKKPTQFILMVPDRNLDRDWNSRGSQFMTGREISDAFAGNGIATVRFDARDSGESVLSGKDYPNLDNGSSDLKVIYDWASGKLEGATPAIIAHGDGCATALNTVNRYHLKPERIVLLGCAYRGTLLESWGERLLHNMSRSGVDQSIIQKARVELDDWLAGKPIPGKDDGEVQADLEAFRKALHFMESEKMASFTRQARTIRFNDLLDEALQAGIPVVQLVGENDDEIPPDLTDATLKHNAALEQSVKNEYTFEIIPATNHFFKSQRSRSESIFAMVLHRMNPFSSVDERFLKKLLALFQSQS